MKKLLFILLFFGFAFSQQIDTTVVGNEIIITETPSKIQPIIKTFNISELKSQYKKAESHRDYYQAIMDRLKWAMEYKPLAIIQEEPIEPIMPKAIYRVPDDGKKDTKELLQGISPIQTKTYWRKATIKAWMDVRGIEYGNRDTKKILIQKVKKYVEEK